MQDKRNVEPAMMTRFKQLYEPFFHHAPIDCHIHEKCLLSEGNATGLPQATGTPRSQCCHNLGLQSEMSEPAGVGSELAGAVSLGLQATGTPQSQCCRILGL